jgi:hypothetical protein
MPQEIKTIRLLLPYHLGSVNCYLIETDIGYILIDTGGSNKRTDLETELASAGCKPSYLKLIVLTRRKTEKFKHTYRLPRAWQAISDGTVHKKSLTTRREQPGWESGCYKMNGL